MTLLIFVNLYVILISSSSGTTPLGALMSDPNPQVAPISIPNATLIFGPVPNVYGPIPHVALILILKQEECNTPILHYLVSE